MKKSRKAGFTLVEIMIVVAIIGLLAAIAIPSFVNARQNSQTKACINNLRLISGGQDQYALDHNGTETTAMADIVGVNNYVKKNPVCPRGGTYTLSTGGGDPACGAFAAASHNATI